LAHDVTWTTPGESTVAGTARGRDAVLAQFGRYGGETDGTFKADLAAVFEGDDGRVIGLHHNSATRAGRELDTDCCIVFEVENGKIASGTEHFFDLYNWDKFWS
jgi:ketosteroid isomerase-like protein